MLTLINIWILAFQGITSLLIASYILLSICLINYCQVIDHIDISELNITEMCNEWCFEKVIALSILSMTVMVV